MSASSFSPSRIDWYTNKIKGSLAEASCRAHFEALGYAVESYGIEHVAPQYCQNQRMGSAGNYISSVKAFQAMPDMVISRVHAKTEGNDRTRRTGKADAVFVEAKFRNEIVLEHITAELLEKYKVLLEHKTWFIVYLVCRSYKHKDSDKEFINGPFVFLNYFNREISKTNGDTGWQEAGKWEGFEKLPLYQGAQDGLDFNQAYRQIVGPAIKSVLSA